MSEDKMSNQGNPPSASDPAPVPAEPGTIARPEGAPEVAVHAEPGTTAAGPVELQSLTPPDPGEIADWNEQVRRRMRQKTRRSFIGFGAAALAGFGAFEWLTTRREIDDAPWPMRKTLEVNEQLARDFFSTSRAAPDPGQKGLGSRINGDVGLGDDFDPSTWQLRLSGLADPSESLTLNLDAVKKLPRVEMTTEFKCIEGWSVNVHWAGARFTDFMQAYPPKTQSGDEFSLNDPEDLPAYVAMSTPDEGYYVGLEMECLLHPQTLLCYEQNHQPLTLEHGAPLRLVVPVKYGVKNIKRIGSIRYTNVRPADYWAEQGYDWYIGL